MRLEDLDGAIVAYPWAFLVTVTDDGRSHSVAAQPRLSDGRFFVEAGRSTHANAASRQQVTLLFPPASGTGYSLIVDGQAHSEGDHVVIQPQRAVLHRPAIRS